MAGNVTPSDTLVGPIVEQLALVAQQINGIGPEQCYIKPPDGPPEDNSVLFPCKAWAFSDMSNGRLRVRLTFDILHVFSRRMLDEALPDIQAYIPAWWAVLGDWNNQTLGGTVRSLDLKSGEITTLRYGGETLLALRHEVTVLTEFLVTTQPH